MIRIIAHIGIGAAILLFPWWIVLVIALAAVIICRAFYEVLIWGLVGDVLYGAQGATFLDLPLVFTAGAFLLVFATKRVKGMTRFY